jgi:hypothetical protein
MPEQKASIGRIVIYNHPGSADSKYPPMQSPAIIQDVYIQQSPVDAAQVEVCDLFVMSKSNGIFFAKGIEQVDDRETPISKQALSKIASRWNWPERV